MNEKVLTPDQKVRIFVSSTLQELQPEREAVRKVIKDDLKLHPIMFEAGASPHPPRERYRAWLGQSHIYVGIFWEFYGWIAPNMEISGIEDEYEIAKQQHLPMLVYVKNPVKGRDRQLEELLRKIEEKGAVSYKQFDNPKELAELVKNDISLILSERFEIAEATLTPQVPPNYLERILQDLAEHGFVERPKTLSQIRNAIQSDKRILLVGEPGCGKTFLLGRIGTQRNGTYISIRDKTPLQVYTYLANRLRVATGRLAERFTNTEEARFDLEVILQNSKATLLIDDLDQNIPLARSLLGLDYYENQVILVARNERVLGGYPFRKLIIRPFTHREIEAYLRQKSVRLTPSKLIELVRACHGNPLYLYYFTHFQIVPLPNGLKAYQDALWRELNATQRELLGLIAVSLFPLGLSVLCDARNRLDGGKRSTTEIASVLTGFSSIIRIVNGQYEIFHPYFKEAIADEVDRLGLSHEYHRVLGETNSTDHRIVEATYHFRRAQDRRADEHLLEAAHGAFLRGLWDIAEEFLRRQLEIACIEKDAWTQGYTRYHLGHLLRDRGLVEEAKTQIQKAIETFESCGDQTWARFAKTQQYLDWISEGKGMAAIDALRGQLDVYEGVDLTGEAMVLVNLSYAYIQVSQFEKGAEVAKRAYEIFTEEGNYDGLTLSLVNLTACLGHLEEYDLTRKYAEEMIALAEELGQPRLKAAGLNHLALVLRKRDDPESARRCLEEAIGICQRLGMTHTEITNILNLGNTYKDQNDLTSAEKCYEEGLAKAKKQGLKKEVGRALELIASLKGGKGDYSAGIDLATKAIEIQKETGDSLRIAESLTERAAFFVALNKSREAAQDYEEAGNHYRVTSNFNDSITCYERAGCLWARLGDEENALAALEKAVESAFQGGKADVAISSIEKLQEAKKIKGLGAFYVGAMGQYVKAPSKASLALSLYGFASYCKLSDTKETRNSYVKVLEILAEHASQHRNICNALIAGIEQADERLLKAGEFEHIVSCLSENMDGFYYRRMPQGDTIWTVVWRLSQPIIFQIQCLSERLTEERLSLVLMLTVSANKEVLCKTIEEMSGFRANSITFMMLGQEEFEEKIQKMPNGALVDERPVVIMQSNVPFTEEQPPIPIVLHRNYAVLADWSLHPENKALVWLIMSFYRSIMEHITHQRRERTVAKKAREFCEGIFGYRELDISKSANAQVRWQIEDIKSVMEKFQRFSKVDQSKNEGNQSHSPSGESSSPTGTPNKG